MKKLGMMALAALLLVAFTVPASAIEVEFGGYWRTRFYTNQNFSGEDRTEDQDLSWVDTRTRLYLTTVFSENLKFVNKFEFDGIWGSRDYSRDAKSQAVPATPGAAPSYSNTAYTLPGADGANFEIKNSYADFNLGPVNAKVGVQGLRLGRSFLFDTDMAGAIVSFNGSNFSLPVMWFKPTEGGSGFDANENDVDVYGVAPSFSAGGATVNPYFVYFYSEDAREYGAELAVYENLDMYYAGLDLDFAIDPVSFWLTGIYQGGEADLIAGGSNDFDAYLGAVGASVGLGFGSIHGEFFYASGDDDGDSDVETFFVPGGIDSYYWAEIMGFGVFDEQGSRNAPTDDISNIMAGNVGVVLRPMSKLKIGLDVWYAQLVEEVAGEDYLGTEVDLRITYELLDNLNLDVVGAYLFAGEATTYDDPDEADPYEVGAQLSLSF